METDIPTRNDSNKTGAKIKSQPHSRMVSLVYHLSDNIESCLLGTSISVLSFQDGWWEHNTVRCDMCYFFKIEKFSFINDPNSILDTGVLNSNI